MNPPNHQHNALAAIQKDGPTLVLVMKNHSLVPPQRGAVRQLDQRMQKMFEVSEAGARCIAGTVDLIRYGRGGYARRSSPCDAAACEVAG